MFGGPDTCFPGKVLKFEAPKKTAKYYILEELLIGKLRMVYIIFNARPFLSEQFRPFALPLWTPPEHSSKALFQGAF